MHHILPTVSQAESARGDQRSGLSIFIFQNKDGFIVVELLFILGKSWFTIVWETDSDSYLHADGYWEVHL